MKFSYLKHWGFYIVFLFSTDALSASVCQSQYTMLHYAKTECHLIDRPMDQNQSFKIKSMLIKAHHPEPKSRPTMILIPGGPGEAADGFRELLEKKEILNALYHHLKLNIILFDPRATGESVLPGQTLTSLELSEKNMSFQLILEDFEALVDYYQLNKVILMSHSMGSFTAMKYAQKNPDKVEKLILISPSSGIKSLGDINLWYYGKDFPLLKKHLNAVNNPTYTEEFLRVYNYIENVAIQQQKAQILNFNNFPEFAGISVHLLRQEILKMLGDISIQNNDLLNYLKAVQKDFESIAALDSLVTPELVSMKLTINDVIVDKKFSWRKIANFLICSESLSEQQKDLETIYDGLIYRFRCPESPSFESISDVDPQQLKTPALIFTGKDDDQVPYFLQKELAESIKNSQWEVVDEGGHFPPNVEPMRFYKSLENFLSL